MKEIDTSTLKTLGDLECEGIFFEMDILPQADKYINIDAPVLLCGFKPQGSGERQ